MGGAVSAAHSLINPPALAKPSGFAHAVLPADGRTVYLAGQTGQDPSGRIVGGGLTEQFAAALANLLAALAGAGGRPEHLVSMQIFVCDCAEYRSHLRELGEIWREHLGSHYPAMGLFGVSGLFDPAARVEVMGVAVIPDEG